LTGLSNSQYRTEKGKTFVRIKYHYKLRRDTLKAYTNLLINNSTQNSIFIDKNYSLRLFASLEDTSVNTRERFYKYRLLFEPNPRRQKEQKL
jgi:hypothetical protein